MNPYLSLSGIRSFFAACLAPPMFRSISVTPRMTASRPTHKKTPTTVTSSSATSSLLINDILSRKLKGRDYQTYL